ncbi:MAG: 23S rRNA (pseudouridine(1915)-N(3))-methyltransferase RlmH [Nitrospirota bacterium]|nr:MAG: 23S rRNA (pseudouridine(1915)-N(3))-methyltransferase RlmH [Nitrospirota bacterium]
MKLRIIWVGRSKENFVKEGISKYDRLISPFCRIEYEEIKDSKERGTAKALGIEAEKILKASNRFTLLSDKGRQYSSVEFAEYLTRMNGGCFVIGGPYGVSERIMEKAEDMISLSKMTFTHEMARIIFLEQVYRALTIINKRGYHH